jgi:Trp operon repressor
MMTPDEDMALKFAVVALRNALLKRSVLSQAEMDVELGDIFAKIAIDKTLGSTLLKDSGLNFAKVEHYARTILHPGYREEQS